MNSNNFNFLCPPPPLPNPPTTGYMEQQPHQNFLPPHQQWNGESRQYLPNNVGLVPDHFYSNQVNTYYPPPPVGPHGYNALVPTKSYRFLNNHFIKGPPPTWLRTNCKRKRSQFGEGNNNDNIVEHVPRTWTIHEAAQAYNIEKEYNQIFKNPSLIIKFPDPEINKEIIGKFHTGIETVYFQQPSSPRFCFVTLKESADVNAVISALNKQAFGKGYLIAERKKVREDDYQTIGPADIDPLTLYVGNLTKQITSSEVEELYPTHRRIDVGHAKKMKYTRYATVGFGNVFDSIEAFKQTHNTELYNRTLIVRFKRLLENAKTPGELTPQNPPKGKNDKRSKSRGSFDVDDYCSDEIVFPKKNNGSTASSIFSDVTDHELNNECALTIKPEPSYNEDRKPTLDRSYISPFLPGPIDNKFIRHKPKIDVQIKTEIKTEKDEEDINNQKDSSHINIDDQPHVRQEAPIEIKEEPDTEDYDYQNEYDDFYNGSDSGEEDILDRPIDFDQLYQNMAIHKTVINSLREKDSV